jgi:hypothetical protein
MKKMPKSLFILAGLAGFATAAFAQTVQEFIPPSEDGLVFRYRVDPGDPPAMVPLPGGGGSGATTGYTGDAGKVWMSFIRFAMQEPLLDSDSDPVVPYETLANASKIVLKTGVNRMEYARTPDNENGGTFSDWYFIPDHYNFPGWDLDSLKSMEYFLAPWHPNAYHAQEFDPTQYEAMPDGDLGNRDQFNLDVDITAAVQQAIADGKLTSETVSFSIAVFPNEVDYYNPETGEYNQDDPLYAPHRNWSWKGGANGGDGPYLEVTTGGAEDWYGYAVDANGWANTEGWMSWVNVTFDPWIWATALDKYVYLEDDSGWVYVAK